MSTNSDLRQRAAAKDDALDGKTSTSRTANDNEETKSKQQSARSQSSFGVVEVLRIVTALVLVGFAASYLVTRGESWIWGLKRPWWTNVKQVRAKFVRLPSAYLTFSSRCEKEEAFKDTMVNLTST